MAKKFFKLHKGWVFNRRSMWTIFIIDSRNFGYGSTFQMMILYALRKNDTSLLLEIFYNNSMTRKKFTKTVTKVGTVYLMKGSGQKKISLIVSALNVDVK